MDSVTQAALGATIAGAIAGKRCNGKVLLAGALLGTLPDLDVFIDYGDDISNMINHRGFSHSLLVLLPFSFLLAWLLRRLRPLQKWSLTRLWGLITAVLVTHPLLDYFTSYGTQLSWPIPGYYSLSSIFIIDPLYTLPLILAIVFGIKQRQQAARLCSIALLVSSIYLGWSLVAKQSMEHRVQDSLYETGLPADKIFITPMPFNTIFWRIVVLDGENYREGMASLFDKNRKIHFSCQHRGYWPLPDKPEILDRFLVFANDFVSYRIENDNLIISDLRMGLPGNLAFQFQFAEKTDGQWQAHIPKRVRGSVSADGKNRLASSLPGSQDSEALPETCMR